MDEAQYQEEVARGQFEQEQARDEYEQEQAEIAHLESEIALHTKTLKDMSSDNPRYSVIWDKRVDLKHRLSALNK